MDGADNIGGLADIPVQTQNTAIVIWWRNREFEPERDIPFAAGPGQRAGNRNSLSVGIAAPAAHR